MRERIGYVIGVGEQYIQLPPLPGAIKERGDGIDFDLTEGLTLRMAWPAEEGEAT